MDWASITPGIGILVMVTYHVVDHVRTRDKNQKHEAETKGAASNELKHIQDELAHPDHGLDALNRSLGTMRENCSSVTSQYSERLLNLEGDGEKRKLRRKRVKG